MTLPTILEPANARITIPVALALGYACYHWWRWRMMHPKIVLEDLPEPESQAQTVATVEAPRQTTEETAPEVAPEPAKGTRPPPTRRPHVMRWKARLERARAEAQLDVDAFDPRCHARAHRKAFGGKPEYFVRLGEYAWRRGAMIETHFWLSMAKFFGVAGLDEWLAEIRRRWVADGRPTERNNVYDQYPFKRGTLARAYLMFMCGFSVSVNRSLIERMAHEGNPDARLILSKLKV